MQPVKLLFMYMPGNRVANRQTTLAAAFQRPMETTSTPHAGSANKLQASHAKPSFLYRKVKEAGRKKLKDQLDYDTMAFVCVSGLPLSAVDLPEWKKLWKDGNADYELASSTTLVDTFIPQEACRIESLTLKDLQTCKNLTMTFDGGTTRLPQSVYMIHIITPDHRVFLMEGNEASAESHTGHSLYLVLKQVFSCHLFICLSPSDCYS